jgi:hypothetical protein
MEDRAPALPSKVTYQVTSSTNVIQIYGKTDSIVHLNYNEILTCHVNASPLAFSDSSSFEDLGKEFRQRRSIRGRRARTTVFPKSYILHSINKG